MCTILLRFTPGATWPVLIAAVRDEFLDRPWDPPAPHWPQTPTLIGGRDRLQGGTWLAVDPMTGKVSAVLNGPPIPLPNGVTRPSRGGLPLAAAGTTAPSVDELRRHDGVHLVRAARTAVTVTSWDGEAVTSHNLAPGDHVLVNAGIDTTTDPLVPFIAPILRRAATPDPQPGLDTREAWGDWVPMLSGAGADPAEPRALIVRRSYEGRVYGSSSATLVAIGADRLRYDFTAAPGPDAAWSEVDTQRILSQAPGRSGNPQVHVDPIATPSSGQA